MSFMLIRFLNNGDSVQFGNVLCLLPPKESVVVSYSMGKDGKSPVFDLVDVELIKHSHDVQQETVKKILFWTKKELKTVTTYTYTLRIVYSEMLNSRDPKYQKIIELSVRDCELQDAERLVPYLKAKIAEFIKYLDEL